MTLKELTDDYTGPEKVEVEYLNEKGVYLLHYTGTEHSAGEGSQVPAATVDGESRLEAFHRLLEHITKHDAAYDHDQ
jgi:hypothetical protein